MAGMLLLKRSFIVMSFFVAMAFFAAIAGSARAQDPSLDPVVSNPDSALAHALSLIEGEPLALDEAIELGLANATEAREAEARVAAARGVERRENGMFRPELFALALKSYDEYPSSNPFAGAPVLEVDGFDTSAGARLQLRLGTQLTAGLITRREETNSEFESYRPQYNATTAVSIRQPLLKGFGPSASSEANAASRELDAAEARRDDALNKVTADVEMVYWDLYAFQRDLAVRWLIVEQSSRFVEETRRRADAGLVGPGDIANARVFLAEQQQVLLDRREQADAISDQLATLIGRRPEGTEARYRPTSEPPRTFAPDPGEELVLAAHEQSPEIRAAKGELEAAKARARGSRWDVWPTLDLIGSIGGRGLGGTGREVEGFEGSAIPAPPNRVFNDVIGDAVTREFPSWSAGVEFAYPLGGIDRGERDRLEAEVTSAEEHLIAVERSVEDRVRAAQRELANSEGRLEAARSGVEAAYEQVRIGIIENRSGRSTAFELVRLGADLATAQQRYSQALVRSAKAAADLRRLTGGAYPGDGTR